ncbi:hypothetical protein [Nonomuraea longicatena]|uniref:YCII-related domain-containing protein n=1 Tax=Nonomuraea longicatena TaxID=83682 RepID=A0ABP3ZD36_9ACTN
MKYLLLVYSDPALPAELLRELAAGGELVSGAALADPVHTRLVRAGAARRSSAHAGEPPSGYLVIDCDGPERAAEIASRIPGAVELRPIMKESGQEM